MKTHMVPELEYAGICKRSQFNLIMAGRGLATMCNENNEAEGKYNPLVKVLGKSLLHGLGR